MVEYPNGQLKARTGRMSHARCSPFIYNIQINTIQDNTIQYKHKIELVKFYDMDSHVLMTRCMHLYIKNCLKQSFINVSSVSFKGGEVCEAGRR